MTTFDAEYCTRAAGSTQRRSVRKLALVEIVLVRHAESTWNAERRWQGQTDVPLSERGREEARLLGARLASERFDRRLCSDLSRTRQTAEAIGGAFEFERALREMDLGAWGGLPHEEVARRFPDEVAAMIAGDDRPIGGGESVIGFERRASDALARIVASSRPEDRVLVVTHGGVIRAILMELLGARESLAKRPLIGAGNTSITHLRVRGDGRTTLVSYNCAAHLALAHDPTDDVLDGEGDEVVRRTIAHLGLAPSRAERVCPPRAGTRTHLAPGMLRAYAVPALG